MDIWKSMRDSYMDTDPMVGSEQMQEENVSHETSSEEPALQEQAVDQSPSWQGIEDIPSEFEAPEKELEWYREKYAAVHGLLNSPEFYDKVFEQYKDQLLSRESEAEDIRNMYKAIKANPTEYIRQYFPESLAAIGVTPVMSADDIAKSVDGKLKEEFGEDYQNLYNTEDLAPFKGNTLTRQIYDRGNEIYKQYQSQNEKNKQIFDDYTKRVADGQAPVTDAMVADYINNEYRKFEQKGISRTEFDSFVNELNDYNPTIEDFYNAKNFSKLIEKAKQEGIEEGKKLVSKNIAKASVPRVIEKSEPKQQTNEDLESYISKRIKRGDFVIDY